MILFKRINNLQRPYWGSSFARFAYPILWRKKNHKCRFKCQKYFNVVTHFQSHLYLRNAETGKSQASHQVAFELGELVVPSQFEYWEKSQQDRSNTPRRQTSTLVIAPFWRVLAIVLFIWKQCAFDRRNKLLKQRGRVRRVEQPVMSFSVVTHGVVVNDMIQLLELHHTACYHGLRRCRRQRVHFFFFFFGFEVFGRTESQLYCLYNEWLQRACTTYAYHPHCIKNVRTLYLY